MKYNAEINLGHLIQIGTILVGIAIGYGLLQSSNVNTREEGKRNSIEIMKLQDRQYETAKILQEVVTQMKMMNNHGNNKSNN